MTSTAVAPAGTTGSLYRAGFVVVRRSWQNLATGPRRGKRARFGFTLHREGCERVQGGSTMPAPAEPYADTVPCQHCRPDDPHRCSYATTPAGVVGTCAACDITVTAPQLKGAQIKMAQEHTGAEARQEMAAALARGPVDRVLCARLRGAVWTLHRVGCFYVGKAAVIRPAVHDADIPESTVACAICRPAGGAPLAADSAAAPRVGRASRPFTLNKESHTLARHRDPGATKNEPTRITCTCGADTGVRPNDNSAKQAMRRIHEGQVRKQRAKQQKGSNST